MQNTIKNKINELIEDIKKDKIYFTSTDLKLHALNSAIYYNDAIKELYKKYEALHNVLYGCTCEHDIFYKFCDDNFEQFKDYLLYEHNIKLNENQFFIGRTSKFLTYNYNDFYFENNTISAKAIFNKFFEDFINYNIDDINNLSTEDSTLILNYLNNDFINDYNDYFENTKIIHDYLNNFKDESVKTFIDFLEVEAEYFTELIEEEKAAEKKKALKIESDKNTLKNSNLNINDVIDILEDHQVNKLMEVLKNVKA